MPLPCDALQHDCCLQERTGYHSQCALCIALARRRGPRAAWHIMHQCLHLRHPRRSQLGNSVSAAASAALLLLPKKGCGTAGCNSRCGLRDSRALRRRQRAGASGGAGAEVHSAPDLLKSADVILNDLLQVQTDAGSNYKLLVRT